MLWLVWQLFKDKIDSPRPPLPLMRSVFTDFFVSFPLIIVRFMTGTANFFFHSSTPSQCQRLFSISGLRTSTLQLHSSPLYRLFRTTLSNRRGGGAWLPAASPWLVLRSPDQHIFAPLSQTRSGEERAGGGLCILSTCCAEFFASFAFETH